MDTLILGGENMGLGPQTLDLRGLSRGGILKIEGYTISGFERVSLADTFAIQNVQFGELNDYFFGEGDFNTVYGNGGNDFLQSGAGIGNRLYGGAGNDIIAALGANSNNPHIASGGDGNDMIIASFSRYADYDANSQLSGGSGADGFVKMHLQDSREADTIVDFKAGEDWLGFGLQSAVHYDLDVTRRIDMPKYNIVNNANNLSFDTLYFGSLGPQGAAHFSYDKKTGILSVEKTEPDDARHGVQFYLKGAPDLALSDFFSMTIQRGGDGNDTVYGNNDSNFLKGDTDVFGIGGNDTIYGEGGDDQIQAGMGNDFIDGGSGADLMFGEKGNDIYIVSEAGDVTFENASEGMDTIRSAISWTLATNVERLELLGSANVSGNGNALANTLIGNAGSNVLSGGTGNDVLDGGAGADRMDGGAGNDTYYVDNANDYVNEIGTSGADRVISWNFQPFRYIPYRWCRRIPDLGRIDQYQWYRQLTQQPSSRQWRQ
ncbi:calcium-binding protein [Phyllobacterium sp. CCNWLW109]|uniref:calcium-binding protein n=1 Tax=Phyllobacterium sp. CCNWLW109 TaxID=3127479 RepID=UPI0030774E47